MATRGEAHDGAVRRLRAAIAEQDRLTYLYEAAIGTSTEATADDARRGADQQVMARDAWLQWVGRGRTRRARVRRSRSGASSKTEGLGTSRYLSVSGPRVAQWPPALDRGPASSPSRSPTRWPLATGSGSRRCALIV